MWRFWRRKRLHKHRPDPGELPSQAVRGLTEYLFVDRPRLTAYVEQIAGPVHREKVPTWDVSLSLAGLGVGAKQTSEARAYTEHEMISMLDAHLRRHSLLAFARPTHRHDIEHAFVLGQVFRCDRGVHRCNDLFAYPIYVRDSTYDG
jgi:hypothetical protein